MFFLRLLRLQSPPASKHLPTLGAYSNAAHLLFALIDFQHCLRPFLPTLLSNSLATLPLGLRIHLVIQDVLASIECPGPRLCGIPKCISSDFDSMQ